MANRKHQTSETTRRVVEALIGYGATEKYTAREVGISIPTLRKYYPDELARSFERVNNKLAETLIQTATRPPRLRDKQGNLVIDPDGTYALDYNSRSYIAALIFASKVRLGLRELHDVKISGDDPAADAREFIARGLSRIAATRTAEEAAREADA